MPAIGCGRSPFSRAFGGVEVTSSRRGRSWARTDVNEWRGGAGGVASLRYSVLSGVFYSLSFAEQRRYLVRPHTGMADALTARRT